MKYVPCPGQGAQSVGMGKDFADKFPEARAIFDRANATLGFNLADLCANGPAERLNQTDMSQPAIYVTSVACHAAAVAAGKIDAAGEYAYIGLSLGEYTALHLAGVFDFETGLRLVAARGKAMQDAAVATPSSMVAIMGADEAAIDKLCAESAKGEVLVPANYNAPGQVVVSGAKDACARVAEAASAAGFRAIPLVVAGAFHSPLMQPGADVMQGELARTTFATPTSTVYSNVTAQPHGEGESIKPLLVDQIVKPVRMEQTLAPIANVAGNAFIELAPGKILTGLLKKQNRRAEVLTIDTVAALA